MFQEIITLIIVTAAVGYTFYSILLFFKDLKNNNMCKCGGCHSKEIQDIIKKSKKQKPSQQGHTRKFKKTHLS